MLISKAPKLHASNILTPLAFSRGFCRGCPSVYLSQQLRRKIVCATVSCIAVEFLAQAACITTHDHLPHTHTHIHTVSQHPGYQSLLGVHAGGYGRVPHMLPTSSGGCWALCPCSCGASGILLCPTRYISCSNVLLSMVTDCCQAPHTVTHILLRPLFCTYAAMQTVFSGS